MAKKALQAKRSPKTESDTSTLAVGARLRSVREQSGMSQRELAKRAGVTNATISLIEQESHAPSLASLHRILNAIPISMAEFFALPVDGDPTRTAWVMMDASSHYLVGDFDGRVFTPSTTRKLSFDHGTNQGYALQTFNHAPGGRRIGMAWARRVRPEGAPFAGAMTVPMELTLKSTAAGPRLHGVPVRELETLRRNPKHFEPRALESGSSPLAHDTGAAFDLEATFEVPADASAGLIVHELRLVYDAAKAALHIGETTLPFPEAKSRFKLRVLVDHGLMEIFANDGAVYLSLELTAAMQKDRALQVIGAGRGAVLTGLSLYEMNSIWEPSGHSSR